MTGSSQQRAHCGAGQDGTRSASRSCADAPRVTIGSRHASRDPPPGQLKARHPGSADSQSVHLEIGRFLDQSSRLLGALDAPGQG